MAPTGAAHKAAQFYLNECGVLKMAVEKIISPYEVLFRFDVSGVVVGAHEKQLEITRDTETGEVYATKELDPVDISEKDYLKAALGKTCVALNATIVKNKAEKEAAKEARLAEKEAEQKARQEANQAAHLERQALRKAQKEKIAALRDELDALLDAAHDFKASEE
jgi:hypothetical protein